MVPEQPALLQSPVCPSSLVQHTPIQLVSPEESSSAVQVVSPPHSHRPRRSVKIPQHLTDFHCPTLSQKTSTAHSLASYVSYENISPSHHAYTLALAATIEPTSYKEACKHACWQQAMKEELLALQNNHTWDIVDLPKGVKPIGSKWVYRVKHHSEF